MKYLAFYILWLTAFSVAAQETNTPLHFHSAVEVGGSYSYSGFNLQLAYVMKLRRHKVYAGPKLVLGDSYLPGQGPWGLQLGYQYNWLGKDRFNSFVNFDYQLAFYKVYNPQGFEVDGSNTLHEFHIGYGIQYLVFGKVWIGNFLGAGGYVECLIDVQENEKEIYSGFSSMFRIFAGYYF